MQDGMGKMVYRGFQRVGIFRENKFIKDQMFLYEGMNLGVYGEYRRSALRRGEGALGLPIQT